MLAVIKKKKREKQYNLYNMSIVKEINDLHISLKTIIFSLLSIMPFWYLAILTFNIGFIKSNQIQIPIVLSFCLTVCYYILNLSTTYFLKSIFSDEKTNDTNIDLFATSIITCVVSIFWLSTFIFIGYYYDWKLLSIIKVIFLVFLIHLVLFFILRLIGKKINKNNR